MGIEPTSESAQETCNEWCLLPKLTPNRLQLELGGSGNALIHRDLEVGSLDSTSTRSAFFRHEYRVQLRQDRGSELLQQASRLTCNFHNWNFKPDGGGNRQVAHPRIQLP